ncbi:MAG: hypothetical protein EBY46_04130 [Rhodobacteraceae bacterium]|nr:hypothetical protein [Paracoccaceae bacterium]
MKSVKDYIRTIVDFPHEGIMFRDVTTLFADPRGFRMCIDQMLHPYAGQPIDKVVGLEARGFILGGAIAHQLGTERLGGDIIGCSFIVDLPELGGRKKLQSMNMDVQVLCEFDGL